MILLNPFRKTPNDFFPDAVAYTIKNEIGADYINGGFTDDPDDSGKATRWGINIFTLSLYRGHTCTTEDVKNLTREEAELVYRALYWNAGNCEKIISRSIATSIFDLGVLFGVGTATKKTQVALQLSGYASIKADGVLGPKSIAALNKVDPKKWLAEYQKLFHERIGAIIESRPSQVKYKNGWASRVDRLQTLG